MHSHCAKCTVTAQNDLAKNPSENSIEIGVSWRTAVSRHPAHFFETVEMSIVLSKTWISQFLQLILISFW